VIFVTVGHQMAFDRMVRTIDQWAGESGQSDVIAQIGTTHFRPEHIKYNAHITPTEFRELVAKADVVVSHAGTGTILTALELGTPILVMPRRGNLRETRNDHQVMTAERFLELGCVHVAMDEIELVKKLGTVADMTARDVISTDASPELIAALHGFIHQQNDPIVKQL
jgi:UDP-N-acetylglucosamine transferase subunit ALG13